MAYSLPEQRSHFLRLVSHNVTSPWTAWARHRAAHERLAERLDELGFDREHRLPQMNTVWCRKGSTTRRRLLDEFGIEIGGGLGPLAGAHLAHRLDGRDLPDGECGPPGERHRDDPAVGYSCRKSRLQ
jgi:hypothetical protein